MVKKVVGSVIALIVVFTVVVAFQPAEFHITRSATISAPAAVIFAQINDFHKWHAWSPWAKMDPNAKNTHEGPASGLGSMFSWSGNKEVGEGKMTIIESHPNQHIQIKLEFTKPFQAVNTTDFTLTPSDKQTLVTWTMSGKNNFMGKAMGLLLDCDKMVGGQFEQGLENLRSIVER